MAYNNVTINNVILNVYEKVSQMPLKLLGIKRANFIILSSLWTFKEFNLWNCLIYDVIYLCVSEWW